MTTATRAHVQRATAIAVIATVATVVGFLNRAPAGTTLIFPYIANDCRYSAGLSWTPGQLVAQGQRDFCAPPFYHSGSYREASTARGGIPIIRPANWKVATAELLRFDYCSTGTRKQLFVLNEPDIGGQDEIPPTVAAYYYTEAVRLFPECEIVWPSANFPNYARQAFTVLGDRWRMSDKVGVHVYPNGYDRPNAFPLEWIGRTRAHLDALGITSTIIVTESGPFGTWSRADLRRFYFELFNSEAERVFIFTTHCNNSLNPCIWKLYETMSAEKLTVSGQEFQRIMFGEGYP